MKNQKKKFEVKHYWSPDIYNPWGWEAEGNAVFYLLEMNIGLTDDDKSDIYSIIIATPEGIINLKGNSVSKPKLYKILLLERYDWNTVRKTIDERLSCIKSLDPIQSSNELANIFYWEYEGME